MEKQVRIAPLSKTINRKENTELLNKLKFVKCLNCNIRRGEYGWFAHDIEMRIDELCKNGSVYYIRSLRAFCTSGSNSAPSAHYWEYLYRIDDLNAFDYDRFYEDYFPSYNEYHSANDNYKESENAIKIFDGWLGYGFPLPNEFYDAAKSVSKA